MKNSSYNLPFYPPDSHHCSDIVYLKDGGCSIEYHNNITDHIPSYITSFNNESQQSCKVSYRRHMARRFMALSSDMVNISNEEYSNKILIIKLRKKKGGVQVLKEVPAKWQQISY